MKEETVANQIEHLIWQSMERMIEQERPPFFKRAYHRLLNIGYNKEKAHHALAIAVLQHALFTRDEDDEDHDKFLKVLVKELIGKTELDPKRLLILFLDSDLDRLITLRSPSKAMRIGSGGGWISARPSRSSKDYSSCSPSSR